MKFLLVVTLYLLLGAALPFAAIADTPPPKSVGVVRVGGNPATLPSPHLDGKLDDEIWKTVRFVDDFRQKDPIEGGVPSVRTEIGFAYDNDALYVAAIMWFDDPSDISEVVTRRDNSGVTDRIIISLDTYHDRRTAYSFSVTAAGARTDYYHGSDAEYDRDYSFDPVWEARTWVGTNRWTAEMRIPFSQLRFNDADQQDWGLNVNRYIPKKNEDIYWIVVPKDGTGWSSRMGAMQGIAGIHPSMHAELLPYAALNAVMPSEVDPGNPYSDKINLSSRFGLDAKVGLGPNLTLDATINPDFGQVEADPAEVNLTAFETSFSEQRPFFVEGAGLFDYNGADHFYSRRIGAAPHAFLPGNFDYVDQPQNSTILGAAKLTGRTSTGLSIGGLVALTEREFAKGTIVGLPDEQKYEVEPLTVYGVGRVQQEFGENASTFGVIGTLVQRDLDDDNPLQGILPRLAITGGADWTLRFADGAYQLEGNLATSHVQGNEHALERIQRSSTHYFQRPDADYLGVDSSRTSLTGYSGSLEFKKESGDWLYTIGGSAESPEYDLNDIGQLRSADDLTAWGFLEYRQTTPGKVFRGVNINVDANAEWDFGGIRQSTTANLNLDLTWANYLTTYSGVGFSNNGLSDSKTRGGPLMDEVDLLINTWIGMYNNFSSAVRWSWHLGGGIFEYDGWFVNARGSLEADLGDQLEVSVNPSYYRDVTPRQYVMSLAGGGEETYGRRYVFGDLAFSRVSMQVRFNYAITPDLSLEVYAEPFVANGHYNKFGELKRAGTGEMEFYDGRINYDSGSRSYVVTDGLEPLFSISNPDFNIRSFRSNVVLRWEWLPGSTLYLVWQQERSGFDPKGDPVTPALWGDAITDPGDNFLALKVSYWLPIEL